MAPLLAVSLQQFLQECPVWPRQRDARFLELRAEGAFLVSSELRAGDVQFVRIQSEKGRDCTIVNPWPGKKVIIYRDGKQADRLEGERFVLKTRTGETIVLQEDGKSDLS